MRLIIDVIHTVGPIGEHPEELTNCYKNCFKIMLEEDLRTIVRAL